MKRVTFVMLLVVSFSVAVFNTTYAGSDDDLVPFSEEELKTFLSDKTYPVGGKNLKKSKGAFYFHADGTLDVLWKGKKETTTWAVEDDSKFCYTVLMFGPRECLRLLKNVKHGGYVQFYEKKKRILKEGAIVAGKQKPF